IYFMPSLTIISLLFFLLLSLFYKVFLYLILFYALSYIIISLVYSIKFTIKEKNPRYLFITVPLYIITHFCYGIGFLYGVLK
ncbi:hypothetical protein DRN58_08070, partial [Thermococci archaeon]